MPKRANSPDKGSSRGRRRRRRTSTGMPGELSNFEPTVWSRILKAQQGDGQAWCDIYLRYRRPVHRFLRARAPRDVDTELLADEVMETLRRPAFLAQVDRSKGRFRDLLMQVARHALYNERRRMDAERRRPSNPVLSLDALETDGPPTENERREFGAFYASEVMEQARERHRNECRERSSLEAECLDLCYWGGLSQADIAARLGKPEAAVNTLIDRGRKRLKEHMREVLREVCSTEDEAMEEVKYLLSLLSRKT